MTPKVHPGFPPHIAEVFQRLWNEVCFLHANWRLYIDLFANDDAVAVVNDMAPAAFTLIERSLRHDIVMAFGRLTDPPESMRKPNLSLERLIADLQPHLPGSLHTSLVTKLQSIRSQLQPVKEVRNRTIGHTDFQTAIGTHPQPLPRLTRSHFEDSANLIGDLMNDIDVHFRETETAFGHPVGVGSGADLIAYLKRANAAFDEDLQRRLRGE
jgi:hypothetical protein